MIRDQLVGNVRRNDGMPRLPYAALACALLFSLSFAPAVFAQSQQARAAVTSDPAPDKQSPAAMETVQVPSHGALLNGIVYVAAGAAPHPVVVLLHGFPGNEKNLDLAQAIRRAGWDVLYGGTSWITWGSWRRVLC